MLVGPYAAGSPTNCSGTNASGIFPLTLTVTSSEGLTNRKRPISLDRQLTVDTRLILDLDRTIQHHFFRNERGPYPGASSVPEPSSLALARARDVCAAVAAQEMAGERARVNRYCLHRKYDAQLEKSRRRCSLARDSRQFPIEFGT